MRGVLLLICCASLQAPDSSIPATVRTDSEGATPSALTSAIRAAVLHADGGASLLSETRAPNADASTQTGNAGVQTEGTQTADASTQTDASDLYKEYECPVTMMVMCDPVVASDGFTYERSAAARIELAHGDSPMRASTRVEGERGSRFRVLVPNRSMKSAIESLMERGMIEDPCEGREPSVPVQERPIDRPAAVTVPGYNQLLPGQEPEEWYNQPRPVQAEEWVGSPFDYLWATRPASPSSQPTVGAGRRPPVWGGQLSPGPGYSDDGHFSDAEEPVWRR